MDGLIRDARHAIRNLRRSPGFASVAVLTLALGIGANTAIFSVVNAVLLRPLPFPEPQDLVQIRGGTTAGLPGNLSPMDFLDLQAQVRSFEVIAAYNNYAAATLTGSGDPERLAGTRVTAGFLSVLRVAPRFGRDFRQEDDRPGAAPVVLLTDGFWRRRFAADARIVGRSLSLNGTSTVVIGVLPPDFLHPFPEDARQPDIIVPFRLDPSENNRGGHYLNAVGRLRSGSGIAAAREEAARYAAELERVYPATNTGRTFNVSPMLDAIVGSTKTAILVLAGAVSFVLLIACANLANLLLARAVSRRRELAVRQALGASRARLVGQLLVESLVLSTAGGLVGLVVASWATRVLLAIGAAQIPRAGTVGLDSSVLIFSGVLSIATGLVFGAGPAILASRPRTVPMLNEGRTSDGPVHRRAQQMLVMAQMALTMMLLVGAGLLAKSLWRLQRVEPGFRAERVLTLQTSLPLARYPEGDQIPFYQQLEQRLRRLPGVVRVGAVNILPLGGNYSCDGFDVEGRAAPPGQQPCAEARSITADYFAAMGIPILEGRAFTAGDAARARPVAIINDRMARTFWPGRSPIGSHLVRLGVTKAIVGVVGGVRHFGLDRDVAPEMYTPHAQQPSYHTMNIVIRAGVDPSSLTPLVRRELQQIDGDVPIANVRTLAELVEASTSQPRFRTLLVGAFAALALVLAAVGVAGVIAFTVSRRTHEIGVRMALGATRGQVVSLIVRQGMAPALAGIAAGVASGLGLSRLLINLLFGVTANDPAVFAAAAGALALVAFGAALVPARRASSTSPVAALRAL